MLIQLGTVLCGCVSPEGAAPDTGSQHRMYFGSHHAHITQASVPGLHSSIGAQLWAWLGLCFRAHLQQRPSSSCQGLICSKTHLYCISDELREKHSDPLLGWSAWWHAVNRMRCHFQTFSRRPKHSHAFPHTILGQFEGTDSLLPATSPRHTVFVPYTEVTTFSSVGCDGSWCRCAEVQVIASATLLK